MLQAVMSMAQEAILAQATMEAGITTITTRCGHVGILWWECMMIDFLSWSYLLS
jgi:hypothetical protein